MCPLPFKLPDPGPGHGNRGTWPWAPKASILREAWCGGQAAPSVASPRPGRSVGTWSGERGGVCFPRSDSPSPAGRRAATGEGAGKKHLITGVSLLVTRRWQRLPWVSRFRERRVFCLEARGLLRSLPRLGGQPAPGAPRPASKCGQAGSSLRGPGWPGQLVPRSSRATKYRLEEAGRRSSHATSDHEHPAPRPHSHTHIGSWGDGLWSIRHKLAELLLAVARGRARLRRSAYYLHPLLAGAPALPSDPGQPEPRLPSPCQPRPLPGGEGAAESPPPSPGCTPQGRPRARGRRGAGGRPGPCTPTLSPAQSSLRPPWAFRAPEPGEGGGAGS